MESWGEMMLELLNRAYQKRPQMLAVGFVLLLAGCAGPEPATGLGEKTAWQPPADTSRWQVDHENSELELRVYRAGPLASFGHNHIIEFPLNGVVYRGDDIASSGFRLVVPLQRAVIDRPAARAAAGEEFSKEISSQARSGTRENMLGPDLLDAASHREIVIESVSISGSSPDIMATLRIRLKGKVFERAFAARSSDEGDRLFIDAHFTLTQSGLGLEQYSALGGGLKVRDDFDAWLHIEAENLAGD